MMLKRLVIAAAILTAIGFGSHGLYLEFRIQDRDNTAAELSYLEKKNGTCTRKALEWTCPTEQMEELREDLTRKQIDLSGAEKMRGMSFGLAFTLPLFIVIAGNILLETILPILIAVFRVTKRYAKHVTSKAGDVPNNILSSIPRITNSATGRTRECPHCAEMIKPQAKVCLHCGRDVSR